MSGFSGGSAWAMTRDIAEGYLLVTERTFQRMSRPDLDQLTFEIDRHLREVRGEQPPLDDIPALQRRNRKIQRLNSAMVVVRSYKQKRRG
jgi:hypothetical protein